MLWRIEPGEKRRLTIRWTEHLPDDAILDPPERRGFGTELLERTLGYELEADTALEFLPTGLRCRIAMPLTQEMEVTDDP